MKVLVKPGDRVEAGAPLVIVESMKMELTVQAMRLGRSSRCFAAKALSCRQERFCSRSRSARKKSSEGK